MTQIRRFSKAGLLAIVAYLTFGCGSNTATPIEYPGKLAAVPMWSENAPEDAFAQLAAPDEIGATPEELPEALTLSESEYLALPQSDRERVSSEAEGLGKKARGLARAAMAQADAAADAGNEDEAAKLRDGVHKLGTELSNARHTKLMQLIGDAILKLGPSTD